MSDSDDFDFQSDEESSPKTTKAAKAVAKKGSNNVQAAPVTKKSSASSRHVGDEDFDDDDDDFGDNSEGGSDDGSPPIKKAKKKPPAPAAKTKTEMKTTAQPAGKALTVGKSSSTVLPKAAITSSSSSSSTAAVSLDASASGSLAQSGDITRGPNITTDLGAKKLILQYLRQQNRPYSAIQVHDNLHKRIPKPTVERVLTVLSEAGGGLCCKEYGKAKIYYPDQSTMTSDFTPAQLQALDDDCEALKKRLEATQADERRLRSEIANVQKEPSDLDLDR
jgi:hypothetical protein